MKITGLNILVTGGAGFIGSHLVDKLIEKENHVTVFDNFDEYYSGKEKNIQHHFSNPNFTLIKADILNKNLLFKTSKSVDVIFHLAAQAGVRFSFVNPNKTNIINTTGTLNILQAAKKEKIKKIIFASSSSVYGVPHYMPIDEKHPTEPLSIYGASKLIAEKYCKIYSQLLGLNVIILRYHTVYGPRQRPDMAIRKWTDLLFDNRSPEIYGDGNQTRDFTYISDIIRGTILAAEVDEIGGNIFNLGGGSNISVNELIKGLIKLTGKDLKPIYKESKLGDVFDTHAKIQKAEKILGYTPKVNLQTGLNRFIKWVIKNNENENN
jgi:UDP-glucose 4-epimerase